MRIPEKQLITGRKRNFKQREAHKQLATQYMLHNTKKIYKQNKQQSFKK